MQGSYPLANDLGLDEFYSLRRMSVSLPRGVADLYINVPKYQPRVYIYVRTFVYEWTSYVCERL